MKMGKNDPRASMSKSTKGRSPINATGRNPIKSASPYETSGVGDAVGTQGVRRSATKALSVKKAPPAEPVAADSGDGEE